MATFEDMFYKEPEPREVSSLDEFFGPIDKSRVKVDRADDWQPQENKDQLNAVERFIDYAVPGPKNQTRQPRSLLDREASQPIEVNPDYMNRQPQTDMPETVPAVADKTVRIMNTPPLTLLSDVAEAVRNKSDEQIRTDLQGAASKVTDLVMRDSLGQYLVPDDMLADKVAKTRSSITGERQAAREQDEAAYDYYNDEATIKERIARNNLRNIQESPKLAQNAVVFTDRLSNLFGLRDDSTVNRAVNQFVAEDKAENGRFSSTQLSDVAGNIARTATEFIAPGKVAGTVIKGANTAARLVRGALSFGLNEAMQMPREGETLSDRTWSVLKNSALGGLVGTVSKLPWPQRITVLGGSFGGTAYLEAYAQTGDHEAALDTAVESLVYLAGFEALGLAQGASRYLKNKFAGKDLARMTPQEVDKVFRDGVHESVQDVKNYRDIVAKYGADSPQAKQAREALRKYVYVEEPTSKAQPVQDGNTAIIRPDTTPAPAVPGQTPAEPTRPVMPMEKPVPATSGLAEMERRANEAIKQPSNTQGSENTGLNLIPDAKNMVESNNISPIEDIIPVPADGNNAINAVEQPTDQLPTQQTVTGAGISEPMESLKQIALALNPNSEVQIETAARSLADDVDQMVQSGQLPAEQRDQYVTDKLTEAGLQGVDPATVDAAGKNYIAGEKAVISLAAGADPTTAVHEAVESQIKSYFGNSDIEASPEFKTFQKSVKDLGLAVYDNNKKALEWFSDFLTDYVFASQKMRKDLGDETVDPVWQAVQDWNAKTKGRGKLAKLFSQMREWFRDTISRARELRKTLYGTKNNVDVNFADDVLKGKKPEESTLTKPQGKVVGTQPVKTKAVETQQPVKVSDKPEPTDINVGKPDKPVKVESKSVKKIEYKPSQNMYDFATDEQIELMNKVLKEAEILPIEIKPDDLDAEIIYRAYTNTTYSPERKPSLFQREYIQHITGVYKDLSKTAKSPGQIKILNDEIQQYKDNYLKKIAPYFNAHSRVASSFITGPANFPVARNQKLINTADRRYAEFVEWQEKAQKSIRKKLKNISIEEAGGELEILKKKLANAEKNQEIMKKANAIIRKRTLSEQQKRDQLKEITNFKDEVISELLNPDYASRTGYASFELTNNLANIKRMKQRVVEIEKKESSSGTDPVKQYKGAEIILNHDIDRVQILFDEKPNDAVVADLKSAGWRWSPKNTAWQRKITNNAEYSAKMLMGRHFNNDPSYQLRKNLKSDVKKTDNVPVTQDKKAARNNISPEETAKAGKGVKVYHGGAGVESLKDNFSILSAKDKQKFPSSNVGLTGLSMTTNKDIAKQYSKIIGQTGNVFEAEINPGAKVMKVDTRGDGIDEYFSTIEIDNIASQGYDAIWDISKGAENEFRALTEKAVLTNTAKAGTEEAEYIAGLVEQVKAGKISGNQAGKLAKKYGRDNTPEGRKAAESKRVKALWVGAYTKLRDSKPAFVSDNTGYADDTEVNPQLQQFEDIASQISQMSSVERAKAGIVRINPVEDFESITQYVNDNPGETAKLDDIGWNILDQSEAQKRLDRDIADMANTASVGDIMEFVFGRRDVDLNRLADKDFKTLASQNIPVIARVLHHYARINNLQPTRLDIANTGSSYFEVSKNGESQTVRIADHEPNYALRNDADIDLTAEGGFATDGIKSAFEVLKGFNQSAGEVGPGDVSYQLRIRPDAYAQELAALSGVKAEKLPKIPAKTVVTGKLEGGFLVGESIKLTDKNRNSLIRQTEREIKKNRQYQEFLDQFRNAIPDMPQGLIQISKHDAGEYRQAVPAGYRKYFIYKENRNDKFAIPWDTVLQRWHESDASISADMPVDDFMRLFTHYRQMLTASDKSIVDLVAYDAAKYEPEIGLLLERRKLLLEGKSKSEVNAGLMEYGKARGMSDTDVRGVFSGKGDILVHSAKDKPIVRQLMRQLTDTQNKLLKERYGTAIKPKTTKQVIKETITPTQEKTVTPAEALRYAMQHEAKGSNEGWKAGQLEIKATQKEAQAFIQNNLPLSERGRLLSALKNATSPKKLEAVIKAVNQVNANYDRREAWKEFLKVKSGLDLKHMRPEYASKVRQILNDISEKSMADKVRNRLINLIKAAEEDGAAIDPAIVQVAKDKLADADKTELKKMEAQAIRDVTNALKHINHMNKLKNELIFGRRAVELQSVADVVVDNLSQQKPIKSDGIKDPKRSRLAELAIEGHIKPDLYSYMIDNGVTRGPFHGIMYEQVKAGERKYLQIQHDGEDALRAAIDKAGLKWGSSELVQYSMTAAGRKVKLIPTVLGNKIVKLSRAERIDLLANILDPDTANEIKRGGVKLSRLRGGNRIRMTWEDIEAFKKSVTPEEMALAEGMRAFLNGQLKNDINNTWVDLAGFPKATRENYWPRQRATEESQKDTGEALRKFGHATLEGQGIFKDREGSKDPVLVRDAFEVYYGHLKQAGAVVGMAIPVRNARVILAHPDVHKALINIYGKQVINYWAEHIDSSTMLGEPAQGIFYKVLAKFQNQFAPAILGLNPSPALKQFVGLVTASIETGNSLYTDGLAMAKPAEMKRIKAAIDKYSPELRQRYRLDGIHLMSPYFDDGKTMLGRRSRQEIVMKPMEYTDRMVVSAIWRNTERRLKKLYPDWNKDQLGEATARRTEKIVNRTQNVTSPVDLSGIGRASRNNPLAKLGTMFMSQANNITNLYYRLYYDYAKNGNGKKFLNSQYKLALGIVASVAIGMALSELYAAGRKDREPVTAGKVAERLLYEFLGNFFGGKEIASLARKSIDAANGKPTFFSNTDNAVESFTNEIGDIFTSTIRAIKEIDEVYQAGPNKGEAKTPKELKKAAFSLAQVMAIAFGIPTKPIQIVEQIDKTIDQNTTKKPVKRRTY